MLLLVYCGLTTMSADFPVEAAEKWDWVWKALVFALFLPLTLRTRLRIEAVALVMVLTAGGDHHHRRDQDAGVGRRLWHAQLFVNDNTGLYEGSIMSCVAIAMIPLIWWLTKHGTFFPPRLAGEAVRARADLRLPADPDRHPGAHRAAVHRPAGGAVAAQRQAPVPLHRRGRAAGRVAIPFLPASYTKRMDTIENHEADQSASTRVAVWSGRSTMSQDHPLGGGFDAYRGNRLTHRNPRHRPAAATTQSVEVKEIEDKARAYHSSYFEMLGEQG